MFLLKASPPSACVKFIIVALCSTIFAAAGISILFYLYKCFSVFILAKFTQLCICLSTTRFGQFPMLVCHRCGVVDSMDIAFVGASANTLDLAVR